MAKAAKSGKKPGAKKRVSRKAAPKRPRVDRGRGARGVPAVAASAGARRPARLISFDEVGTSPESTPSNPQYGLRILAEGDSWFSMGAIPSTNLLAELRFAQDTIIVNAAYPGDTIRHMSEISDNLPLRRMLVQKNFAYDWDLILLSGGGNDLIDAASSLIVPPAAGGGADPRSCVDATRLALLVADVQAGYRHIAALRAASERPANRNVPIVTHIYDFPTPRDSPAKFVGIPVRGPWLYRALERAGIADPALRQGICDYLLTALGNGIAALTGPADPIANFHIVATRGLLVRAAQGATGSSGDWQNEIHPNATGYRKLGAQIAPAIEALRVPA
jgi:lysophospholipase L1-like esterase